MVCVSGTLGVSDAPGASAGVSAAGVVMTDGLATSAAIAVTVEVLPPVGVGLTVGVVIEAHAVALTTSTATQTQFNRLGIRPS